MSPLLFSRSEIEALQRCEREAFYRYYFPNGTPAGGWVPKEPPLALTLGSCGHKGMQVLFELGSNVDQAVQAAQEEWDRLCGNGLPIEGAPNPALFVQEQKALLEAFLRAWRIQFWDSFNNQYEVLSIERENSAPTPFGSILQLRCDLVLRERETGLIWIPDWKFVKDGKNWGTKWGMESQTWSQTWGTEQVLGERVAGAIYWGFIKGDRRDGRQLSSLLYPYRREIRPGVFEYSPSYQRSKGWERIPVWENPDFGPPGERIKYWVNWLPEEERASQFVVSPPIMRDPLRQEEWIKTAHQLVQRAHERVRSGPSAFHASRSSWNCQKCVYRKPCYDEVEWEEAQGGMLPRIDHHAKGEE